MLFSVQILMAIWIEGRGSNPWRRELAVHIVTARDENEARQRGEALGHRLQHSYENCYGETVALRFEMILDVQNLYADTFKDGMEVGSWTWRGERPEPGTGWVEPRWRLKADADAEEPDEDGPGCPG